MTVLEDLLLKNHRYDTYYWDGLSNHMSMSLIALSKLHSNDSHLEHFFDTTSKKLELFQPVQEMIINDDNLINYLGTYSNYADWVVFFENKLDELGCENMLQKYLPLLISGIGASGFHGLLRLAYGILMYNDNLEIADKEIAIALATWADGYITLSPKKNNAESSIKIMLENIDRIRLSTIYSNILSNGLYNQLIYKRFKYTVSDPLFSEACSYIKYSENNMHDLANFCVNFYCTTFNFIALHAVTATYAFRLILPYIADKDTAINHFWHAIFTAYLSAGAPHVSFLHGQHKPNNDSDSSVWEQIRVEACNSLDDHMIKLAQICKEEYEYYGNSLFIKAASTKYIPDPLLDTLKHLANKY